MWVALFHFWKFLLAHQSQLALNGARHQSANILGCFKASHTYTHALFSSEYIEIFQCLQEQSHVQCVERNALGAMRLFRNV